MLTGQCDEGSSSAERPSPQMCQVDNHEQLAQHPTDTHI